jgi:hypothetical protein
MALTISLIASNQGSYSDSEFSKILTDIFSEGIFNTNSGNDFKVTESTPNDMSVDIDLGQCLVSYTKAGVTWKVVTKNTTSITKTINGNTSGSNRVDAVVVHLTQDEPNALKNNVAEVLVIDGTGVSALADGAIDTEVGDQNWYRLADITVPNGASSITNSDISDTRSRFTVGPFEKVNTDSLEESTSGNGILVDGTLIKDGFIDNAEITIPSTPDTGRWKAYFKTDGFYILDDTGEEYKIALGGASTSQKAEATAALGELFENTDAGNTLSWKDSNGDVYDLQGDVWQAGETIAQYETLSPIFVKTVTTNINPTDDTYVHEGYSSTNYSSETSVNVRLYSGHNQYGLFKFSSGDFSTPGFIRIISFEFKFYNSSGAAPSDNIIALPITASWTPSSVNWDTKPAVGSIIGTKDDVDTGWNTILCEPDNTEWNQVKTYGVQVQTPSYSTNFEIDSLENASGRNAYIDNIIYVGYDGKLYKHSAGIQEVYDEFIGFAPKALSEDDYFVPKIGGDIIGLSASRGVTYYLSTTADGEITTGATSGKKVGTGVNKGGSDSLQILIENN